MGSMDISGALVAAALWIPGVLDGSVALLCAQLGVGLVGYAAVMGRVDLRRMVRAVVGIFLILDAPVLGRGLSDLRATPTATENEVRDENLGAVPIERVQATSSYSHDPFEDAAQPIAQSEPR